MQNYGWSHKRFAFPLRGDLGAAVRLFSSQVFRCARLDARGILGLREDELIGRLTKVFQGYKGRDSIRLVWGHQGLPDSFVGIPLKENSISVVASRPTEERKRHLWKPSRDQRTRQLSAAHILTAFWKLRFLEKMKERRRYFAPRYKYPKNCCLMVDMEGDRNWMYWWRVFVFLFLFFLLGLLG